MPMFTIHLPEKVRTRLTRYRFEIRHIMVIFGILIAFQVSMVFFQKLTLSNFLTSTQSWFQKYYAERIALVTTTNVELLYEQKQRLFARQGSNDISVPHSFDIIVKQQLIHKSVDDICLILIKNHKMFVIDNGEKLDAFFNDALVPYEGAAESRHEASISFFLKMRDEMLRTEKIMSTVRSEKTFDVLVPFVPDGEYLGVFCMRITPDFSFLTSEIKSSFDTVSWIFFGLISAGLIAIFLVSSSAVRERNRVQEELFVEHEQNLEKQIRLEKESLFTKRIYHTHHKAEKIMGFIKADVRKMDAGNLNEMKSRVIAYSNFISRIIYDMKWYDHDINTIINPLFRTDINTVIEFIVQNVFLRLSSRNEMFEFKLDLDAALPPTHVNEFTVWEILEPLIQNSIDHCGINFVTIRIETSFDRKEHVSRISIANNGKGIVKELLEEGPKGVKRIFMEDETTKKHIESHSGYGCYIAHQIAAGKCGWGLDVENLDEGGCRFNLTIRNEDFA